MERPLSAVWAASRAGVRRRRLQTVSIGVVVALSTATLLFGFGLLAASNSLFDDAFARARGAQATAAFDAAEVSAARVAATARAAGVTAAAGPFQTAVLRQARASAGMPGPGQDLRVAGRADPGGPVDRLTITSGRWVRGPGEIVLHGRPGGALRVGGTLSSPGLPELTIVGFAISVTGSADGWVAPAQIGALRPDGLQMLYRFARAGDSPQVQRSLAEATAGLPVTGNESYVTVRQAFQERFNQLIPFITVFGALAMAVSAIIIGTVVSGAVVAGFRHIGVLKALGFTPAQVTAVYLVMVMTPALAGCAAGVAAGHLMADAMAENMARGFELPSAWGATLLLDAAAGGCVVVLVALAALGPALRAGRLPAVQAISAGAVSRRGRGRGPQRWLARTRLPAPVALGLGLPVARPARTALVLTALGLGVTAATLGLGLHQTVSKIMTADPEGHTSVTVGAAPFGPTRPDLSERQVFTLLREQPGTAHVMSYDLLKVRGAGLPDGLTAETYNGDYRPFLGDNLIRGRWFTGPGEVVPSESLLRLHHLRVGDTLTLRAEDGAPARVRIVGSFAQPDPNRLMLDARNFPDSEGAAGLRRPISVIVTPGTAPADYAARINALLSGDGMSAKVTEPETGGAVVFHGLFLLLSLIICTAAGLGVLNGVLLNAQERSRDLGVLKAVGMTPRQVALMMVTSMAALGAVGAALGIPLGVAVHHAVVDLTGRLTAGGMAASWIHVYDWWLLALPACAGLLIAVLGSWPPAGRAAATRTATVLRGE
ncbi:hypothetical protein Acsp04_51400 [Actinomadura sp. NBRC 104425]|uniref:ABC transporter permease n=1 Tax=Actinomadura sp. NBRC 104425 TaxID=3032204 RepID=UPI0024A2CFEE|nr:ABC transporter permease [Actinomadura sp. NBRC 104425]GLZ14905.1 hypothetical protein Acsp04_51400 [Actinomadura sp. NBRC 104425]